MKHAISDKVARRFSLGRGRLDIGGVTTRVFVRKAGGTKTLRTMTCGTWAVFLLTIGSLHADEPPLAASPKPVPVLLGENETLSGRLLDGHGHPIVGAVVKLVHKERPIAAVRTDASGQFKISGLRSGLHDLDAKLFRVRCDLLASTTQNEKAYKDLIVFLQPPILKTNNSIETLQNLTEDLTYRAGSTLSELSKIPENVSIPAVPLAPILLGGSKEPEAE